MLTNKALLIGSTLIVSAGAGVGGYFLFHNSSEKEQTIEKLLSLDDANKGKARLTVANKDNGWLDKWTSYITANTTDTKVNTTDILGISNWGSINSGKTAVPKEFAKKCEELSTDKVENKEDKKYINYTSWCIK